MYKVWSVWESPGKIKKAKSRTTRQVSYIIYNIDNNLTPMFSVTFHGSFNKLCWTHYLFNWFFVLMFSWGEYWFPTLYSSVFFVDNNIILSILFNFAQTYFTFFSSVLWLILSLENLFSIKSIYFRKLIKKNSMWVVIRKKCNYIEMQKRRRGNKLLVI
jgi:hypothetical protein